MRRGVDPFDWKAMLYSAVLHGAIFGVAWLSTFYEPPEIEFITFEIDLVSPPPAAQADQPAPQREELVVERPEPEPPPPEPEPEQPTIEREPEPEPEPPQPQPEPEPEPPEPDDEPAPAVTTQPPPEEPPPTSGEGLNVRMEGLRRDYPAYYNNIIRQIQRCFRWQGGPGWSAQVFFVIRRDGTVRDGDVEFRARSGNTAFDFEAMGAVECAGQGRFGPLPEDLPYESQPVLFEFRPIGQ